MNKRLILFSALLFFTTFAMAQLVNNGAIITVKDGATLIVDNDITNTSGSIVLEGTASVELSGDFTNDDILTTSANSTVKFYGTSDSNVKSNGDDFGILILDKTAADLVLVDPFFLTTDVTFNSDNNKIDLGAFDFNLLLGSTLTSFDNNEYFQVDGSGMLKREVSATGNYTLPVGDISAYSPIDVDITAGSVGTTDPYVAVKVTDADHPNLLADADAYISRYWQLEANDISGYAATLTGTYVDADVNGTETLINGATYASSTWSFAGADGDDAANTVTADVTDLVVDFTGKNFYGKLSVSAFLEGPFNTGTGEMNTGINSLLPTTSPYDGSVSVTSIPNTDIVDWINLETREVGTPSNVLTTHSLFLKKDGSIVALDGTSNPYLKDAPTSAHIAIRHRNHLGMRSLNSFSLDSNPVADLDFTDPSFLTYGTNAQNQIGSIMAMISGDANSDGQVNAVDKNDYWLVQNGQPYTYATSTADFNLDSAINAVDKNDHWIPNNSKAEQLD